MWTLGVVSCEPDRARMLPESLEEAVMTVKHHYNHAEDNPIKAGRQKP